MNLTPTLTTCDMCNVKMAAMPGPMRKLHRPSPPDGYELGYIVEQADRWFPICCACLVHGINASLAA